MTSPSAAIFAAVKTRLLTIRKTAGYTVDVQKVNLDSTQMTLQVAPRDLPIIEIIKESRQFEHMPAGHIIHHLDALLYMVAPKPWTDAQMEDMESDVIKALFANAPNATVYPWPPLGGIVQDLRLVDAVSDLNLIESNRVYMLRIRLSSNRRITQG